MAMTQTSRGSGALQGELWSARADDWADAQEPAQREMYPPVLDAAGVGEGTRLLDVGCGSGVAAELATALGAKVSGIDAAYGQVERARARVPSADFRVGEMEVLPYESDSFDVVT